MNKASFLEKFNTKRMRFLAKLFAVLTGVVVLVMAWMMYFGEVMNVEKSLKYNIFMLIPFLCFTVVTVFLGYLLTVKKEFSYERIYLLTALLFGISMQIIMPPISGPDENTHFLSAYHCSDVILMMDDYGPEQPFYQRVEEQKYPQYYINFPACYELLADGNWFGVSDADKELFIVDELTVSANRYPLSGFGIALARLLNFGVVGLLYCGRLMNMLGMVILGYMAVKLTPYGKAQIVGFSMIPLILELCNSYSYDNMSIMMTILFAVLCLRYSKEEIPLTYAGLYGISTVYAFLVPQKTVYLFFFPFIFMIPFKKIKEFLFPDKTVKTILKFLAWLLYTGFVLFLDFRKYLAIAFGILGKGQGEAIEQVADRPSFTIGYMIHNPGHVFSLLWNTLIHYGWDDAQNVFGSALGSHKLWVYVPEYLITALMIIILLTLLINRGNWIGKKKFLISLIGIIIVLGAIILGCFLRFTPIEGTDRLQVAGRYYLPVFLTLSIMLGTDKKENKGTLTLLYLQNCVLVLIMCSVLGFLIKM